MKPQMNEYIQILHEQIGRAAFFMMNARNFIYDNKQNALQWRISNSSVSSVRVAYVISQDLYKVSFITETPTHPSEVVYEQIEANELHDLIEQITGLTLQTPIICRSR